MKTRYILITALLWHSACNTGQKEIDQLSEEKLQLMEETRAKDSVIVSLVDAFNAIEDNLDTVKERQGIISLDTRNIAEMQETQRDKIIRDIQMINQLMDDNKKRLALLTKKMKKAGVKIASLEKMIAHLQKNIEEKDAEIARLKDALVNLNFSYDSLSVAYVEQSDVLEEKTMESAQKTKELNTAYYCYGSFKELRTNGVLTKEGGFIGLGKTEKLADDFNKKYFTQIDITEIKTIDLKCKKARLVTIHPPGSYKFEGPDGKTDKLIIMNAEEFWSASKYLVVIVD